jgi:hypothetical protein
MWSVNAGKAWAGRIILRPGLMLDFSVAGWWQACPSRAVVSVTRYSDPELGGAGDV